MNDTHAHSLSSHHCRSRAPRPQQQRQPEADARDVALLAAIRDGDEHAFWALWMNHSRRLFGLCLREMNGNREDAEDALQEAMLHAHAKLPRFAASIAAPASWLTRITSNVCKDIHRRHTRRTRLAEQAAILGGDALQMPEAAAPPIASCDPAALIARLPERLRDVFTLRILQHASYGDIATRLGLTCATARKRVQESRSALRDWRDGTPP
jgi:RNA polymerase sigma factor (sigma-70 family)